MQDVVAPVDWEYNLIGISYEEGITTTDYPNNPQNL